MARTRNPRRLVLDQLKQVTQTTKWIRDRWTVSREVWQPREDGGPRPRQPHEYPENSPQHWRELDQAARMLRRLAYELESYAEHQGAGEQEFTAFWK